MIKHAFKPHFVVFNAMREHLRNAGFDYDSWHGYPYALPEIPRPNLFHDGHLGGVNLGKVTANFPHPLDTPPVLAYDFLLEKIGRDSTGRRGRPVSNGWRLFASEKWTSINTIMTPMRAGYYGVKRPQLAMGYHVAEFAVLLWRAFGQEQAPLEVDVAAGTMMVEHEGRVFGLYEGKVLNEHGELIEPGHDVDLSLLSDFRETPGLLLSRMFPMWRAVYAFSRETGLVDDIDFMQAVAHCRWAIPPYVRWRDEPNEFERNNVATNLLNTAEDKALRVEESFLILKQRPEINIREVRQRLVPYVMSREDWSANLAPLTRSKLTRRKDVIDYLERLHGELLTRV